MFIQKWNVFIEKCTRTSTLKYVSKSRYGEEPNKNNTEEEPNRKAASIQNR